MNNFGYVFATKMLVEGRRKVRFMYREEPEDPNDSGWRFFCGDEDQEYADNPDRSIETARVTGRSHRNICRGTALRGCRRP